MQQVSLASAGAAFEKLNLAISQLAPASFLDLEDEELKNIGFSGQKGRYCRALSRDLLDRSLDLDALCNMSDQRVRRELTSVTGIGPWTADIYLLMALRRPDVWPRGDLALVRAARDLRGLEGTRQPTSSRSSARRGGPGDRSPHGCSGPLPQP
jgi:DNA-3-methyladenine glycosylase II